MTTPMTPVEFAERMKLAIKLLDELAAEMNDKARNCQCCGLVVRENMDDFQGKQAFEAASNRVAKCYEKLIVGLWTGRPLIPVVDASEAREGGKP